MGLYQEVRPTNFSEVVGQEACVSQLESMLAEGKVPHAILFSGPSGCGKTTLARILASRLGATGVNVFEKNAASDNGVDTIREIESRLHLKGLGAGSRVYIIDEAHQITTQGQRAMLKMLEDTPAHVYFILCTTNPEKLEKPVQTRLSHFKVANVPNKVLAKMIEKVAAEKSIQCPASAIADAAQGSPRQALVLLEQIGHTPKERWPDVLQNTEDLKPDAFQLVKDLYASGKLFPKHGLLVKDLQEHDIERLRMAILSYGCTIILNGGETANAQKAKKIMGFFTSPFFSSKKPGFVLALSLASA